MTPEEKVQLVVDSWLAVPEEDKDDKGRIFFGPVGIYDVQGSGPFLSVWFHPNSVQPNIRISNPPVENSSNPLETVASIIERNIF